MKITVITTGGTIGCKETNGMLCPGADAGELLERARHAGAPDAEYEILPLMNALSENMTGGTIVKIAGAVKSALASSDGVIVTHGTDTLDVTAAALSYALGEGSKPVAIASANLPPDAPGSDAPLCLAACAAVACSELRGAYACCVRGSVADVHRASRLLPCLPYSGERYSLGGGKATFSCGVLRMRAGYTELPDALPPADMAPLLDAPDVTVVQPGPLCAYPPPLDGVRAVVFLAFHSGTLPTGCRTFADYCAMLHERGIKAYAACSSPDVAYESAALFGSLHIRILPRMAPAAAAVKLRLGLPPELSLGGDIAE